MIFSKVKIGDRVQIAEIKSQEFTVRSYTFWCVHTNTDNPNYIYQELYLKGFGTIHCKYVTEIL